MPAETYPVPRSARELKARGALSEIATRRAEDIGALVIARSGTAVPLYGESGQSGVTVFISGQKDISPAVRHENHAVVLYGVGKEPAVVTSGGVLINPTEKTVGRVVEVGEFHGDGIRSKPGVPVVKNNLIPGGELVIPPDTPYQIRPINGATSAVLGLKFRPTESGMC